MIKVFYVYGGRTEQTNAIAWLKENLGTEGVRWWTDGRERPTMFHHDGTKSGGGLMITLDVTDEEDSIVTAFALRFS